MTAKELRIGNYVMINDKVVMVDNLTDTGINFEVGGGYYAGEGTLEYSAYFEKWGSFGLSAVVEPIPLTPELLEKIGFEEDEAWPDMYGGRRWNRIVGDMETGIKDMAITESNGKIEFQMWPLEEPLEIEYLHQLQNLYFALTGEEMEVSL
jgi:hypothetical protein